MEWFYNQLEETKAKKEKEYEKKIKNASREEDQEKLADELLSLILY